MNLFFREGSQRLGIRLMTLDYFLCGKNSFVLPGLDIYSGYKFSFPAYNTSSITTIHALTNASTIVLVFYTLILTNEFISQSEKCGDGGPESWKLLISSFLHCPEVAYLIMFKSHFKDTVAAPVRWEQFGGLEQGFSTMQYMLWISQYNVAVSPLARIHESRNQRVEKRIVPLLPLVNH